MLAGKCNLCAATSGIGIDPGIQEVNPSRIALSCGVPGIPMRHPLLFEVRMRIDRGRHVKSKVEPGKNTRDNLISSGSFSAQ
jgi:hypothetical protein